MAVSLGVTVILQTKMKAFWWLEFLLLMGAGIFILGMFFGLWVDAEWGFPLATILFALALANVMWLYSIVNNFTLFAAGILVNITGIVVSMTGIGRIDPEIETYDVDHIPHVPEKERNSVKAEEVKEIKSKKTAKKKRGRPKKK